MADIIGKPVEQEIAIYAVKGESYDLIGGYGASDIPLSEKNRTHSYAKAFHPALGEVEEARITDYAAIVEMKPIIRRCIEKDLVDALNGYAMSIATHDVSLDVMNQRDASIRKESLKYMQVLKSAESFLLRRFKPFTIETLGIEL
ncbi:MAG: hypothetical protein NT016_02645 [Candidatus Aenigmarchaeota archaeon]|nr:hypothetical protein [Candidatus Aenigmarchaeota archaeon]